MLHTIVIPVLLATPSLIMEVVTLKFIRAVGLAHPIALFAQKRLIVKLVCQAMN